MCITIICSVGQNRKALKIICMELVQLVWHEEKLVVWELWPMSTWLGFEHEMNSGQNVCTKSDFSHRLNSVEFSLQICSYGYHITSGTWILPTLTPGFIPFQPFDALKNHTHIHPHPYLAEKPLLWIWGKIERFICLLIKVNYKFSVRNFSWIRNITWMNINTFQFFEYTWTFCLLVEY